VFNNKYLRKILNIPWQDIISKKELWNVEKTEQVLKQIRRRNWTWLGHTLTKKVTTAL